MFTGIRHKRSFPRCSADDWLRRDVNADMDESTQTQNRRSRRSNVLMAAAIETENGLAKVTLRNLSADGALIEGDGIPQTGAPVVFRKKDLVISGNIAWVNERRAGISFDAKLEPETVLRHIPAPRHRIEHQFKRPGLTSRLTPEERRWCETFIWDAPLPSVQH